MVAHAQNEALIWNLQCIAWALGDCYNWKYLRCTKVRCKQYVKLLFLVCTVSFESTQNKQQSGSKIPLRKIMMIAKIVTFSDRDVVPPKNLWFLKISNSSTSEPSKSANGSSLLSFSSSLLNFYRTSTIVGPWSTAHAHLLRWTWLDWPVTKKGSKTVPV